MFEPFKGIPEHGGALRQAVEQFGMPLAKWLDLSTGINPHVWPIPEIPIKAWHRLPECQDGLETAATQYYGSQALLPVAGSQMAIQILPLLRPQKSRIGVIFPSYTEHTKLWQQLGHQVQPLLPQKIESSLSNLDVLVIVNPNNPTGHCFEPSTLLAWHDRLGTQGSYLIVDEAFMDGIPEYSLTSYCPRPGLIVLRSLGKFFGLAGARVGFVFAPAQILQLLQEKIGPWAVAGPSRWVATQALLDTHWQTQMRQRLKNDSTRLHQLLSHYGLKPTGSTSLFQWVETSVAQSIYYSLAQQGILIRYFPIPMSLRFGLPRKAEDWLRLEQGLENRS